MKRVIRGTVHGAALAVAAAVYVVAVVPVARASASIRRRRDRLPRIMWGTTPLISIRYWSEATRLYGYDSETVVDQVYPINERSDFDVVLDRAARLPLLRQLFPYAAFVWAGFRYDIFCLFFDGGLLARTPSWRAELPLMKLAGKKIIVSPYGSDARLPSRARAEDRWNVYADVPVGAEDRAEDDVRRHLEAFGRWADVMLGYNDLAADLPRAEGMLPFALDLERWRPVDSPGGDVVTVVHSSNHRHYKGTRFVVAAVEQLQREGLPLELVIVEGARNDEAKRVYERADILATDFLIGGYSYVAVEGMALGKPVLSYMRESLWPYHPEWRECPIASASPETLPEVLRRLALDPELRAELSRRGPEYVRKYHSLEAVGAQLDRLYRDLWAAPEREPELGRRTA